MNTSVIFFIIGIVSEQQKTSTPPAEIHPQGDMGEDEEEDWIEAENVLLKASVSVSTATEPNIIGFGNVSSTCQQVSSMLKLLPIYMCICMYICVYVCMLMGHVCRELKTGFCSSVMSSQTVISSVFKTSTPSPEVSIEQVRQDYHVSSTLV